MVRTPCFHCRGPELDLWSGNWDPSGPAARQGKARQGKAKKKKKLTSEDCMCCSYLLTEMSVQSLSIIFQ